MNIPERSFVFADRILSIPERILVWEAPRRSGKTELCKAAGILMLECGWSVLLSSPTSSKEPQKFVTALTEDKKHLGHHIALTKANVFSYGFQHPLFRRSHLMLIADNLDMPMSVGSEPASLIEAAQRTLRERERGSYDTQGNASRRFWRALITLDAERPTRTNRQMENTAWIVFTSNDTLTVHTASGVFTLPPVPSLS